MKKLTFDDLENTLDREEMRNIMAGSGGSGSCQVCADCPYNNDVSMVCCAGVSSCSKCEDAGGCVVCDGNYTYCFG